MILPDVRQKLFEGSLMALFRVALAIPVYVVLTPLVLHALGPERFGIWAFSTIILSLMSLGDLGFKDSLVHEIAKVGGRSEEVRRSFSLTLLAYLAIGGFLMLGTAAWGAKAFPALLNIPESFRDEAEFVFWVTMAGFVWRLLALPYQAVIEGHQEQFRSQLVYLAWLIVHFLGTLIALAFSPTVYGLGWAALLGNLFVFAAFFRTVRTRFPHVRLEVRGLSAGRLRSMAAFGAGIQIASICIALREPLYKVLLARTSDLASVAAFEIAYKLCTQLMSVTTTPLVGLFGAAALFAGRHRDLATLLRPLVGCTLGALLPGAIGVALFAQPLMRRWLDRTDLAAGLLPVMYAGFSIYYASEALYKTIEGSGRSRYSAVTQVAVLLVQIAGFWALAPLQARGAAWSLVAGFALFSLSNLIMFRSCFPEIRLLTHRQWAALLLPSSVYALGAGLFPPVADPLPFLGYLLAHLVALVRSGLVDTEKLLRRLAAMRDGLSSVAAPAGRETK